MGLRVRVFGFLSSWHVFGFKPQMQDLKPTAVAFQNFRILTFQKVALFLDIVLFSHQGLVHKLKLC